METFLESLAKAYAHEYKGSLAHVCFVFPGKRAGSFFLRYLRRELKGRVEILPQVTTIADFVETLSGRVVDSRIDMVCLLYDLYRRWCGRDRKAEPFEKFLSWADTMLADFNDVEMYRVNPEALFRNVRQLKGIRSNYLTEEQMKVMHQYFGFSDFYNANDGHLWQHYHGDSPITKKFLSFFDSLGDIYNGFCEALESRGLTFPGRAYAQALEALTPDAAAVLDCRRVVLAGFNALTTVEFLIFKTLAKAHVTLPDGSRQPLADFYWDCTGVPLQAEDNIGRHFVERNRRHFPSIYDLGASDCNTLPQRLETIVAPSGVAQAKIAGTVVGEILQRHCDEHLHEQPEIAVVLPDESLLLPMLYSMPKGVGKVNLTMGYPFSMTSVATFVGLLESYQHYLRLDNGEWKARTEDADAVLSHPLMILLAGAGQCRGLSNTLRERRRVTVPASLLTASGDVMAAVFTPLGMKATSVMALNYLSDILRRLDKAMQGDDCAVEPEHKLDHTHVVLYMDALRRLQAAFEKYGIGTGAGMTFRMASRLLATEAVHFKGEPLKGVQVMGPLETRSLDFKYLVIPSMNERIYPRRLHQRSFIPAVVRRGFGMATQRFQEAIFTYYFYRMISRAREVYLIYDSRTEGLHSGSPSRFILQLQYLYAKGHMQRSRYRFGLSSGHRSEVNVVKTPQIMEAINKYFQLDKGERLSASSVNTYISCPLKFYLQNLSGINRESAPADGMRGNDLGSIVHQALQQAYTGMVSESGSNIITELMLNNLASDKEELRRLVVRAINKEYYNRPKLEQDEEPEADINMYVPLLMQSVADVLRYDARKSAPFQFISAEERKPVVLTLPDGKQVNFLFICDRIDCKDISAPGEPLRIVDYKTGHFNVAAKTFDEIFESDHPGELFQLVLYGILYKLYTGTNHPVKPVIYNVAKMVDSTDRPAVEIPRIGKEAIADTADIAPRFLEGLQKVLVQMCDPQQPFRQAPEGAEACRYCPFAQSVCEIPPEASAY